MNTLIHHSRGKTESTFYSVYRACFRRSSFAETKMTQRCTYSRVRQLIQFDYRGHCCHKHRAAYAPSDHYIWDAYNQVHADALIFLILASLLEKPRHLQVTSSHPGAIQEPTQHHLIRTKDTPITQEITRASETVCQEPGAEMDIYFPLSHSSKEEALPATATFFI